MMVKQIEKAGVPIVHLASMTPVSMSIGSNRIVQGIAVPNPCCDPLLPEEEQLRQRIECVECCLRALETDIKEQKIFYWNK